MNLYNKMRTYFGSGPQALKIHGLSFTEESLENFRIPLHVIWLGMENSISLYSPSAPCSPLAPTAAFQVLAASPLNRHHKSLPT